MSVPRPRLLALLSGIPLVLAAIACGDPPPPTPAAVPEEFDDPFADEQAARTPPEPEKLAAAAPVPEASKPPEPAIAGSPGPTAPPVEPVARAPEPAVDPDKPTSKKTAVKPATAATTPAPKDSPAPPPPEPTPTPAPTPAPLPVTEPTPAPTPVPAAPVVPPQQRFAGTFKFSGGETQRANLETAIEAAAQQLSAIIRPIGRKRLRESNPIREQITITVDGDRVTTSFTPGRSLTGTLGGPSVPWTSDSGKPVQVAFSLLKGRFVQVYTAEDGGRRSVYTLDDTGDRLTLSVTITSERLTEPLKYALTYRRSGG